MPEYPSQNLGEILAFLRKQAGLNLFALKHKSGVTDSSILRIERGDTQSPRADSCVKLARALDLPWVFFLTLAGRMIPAEDALQARVLSYPSLVRAWWRGELRREDDLSPEARGAANDEYLKLQDLFLAGTGLELDALNEDVSRQPAARILARALADGGDAAFALWFAGRVPREFFEHDSYQFSAWEREFDFNLDEQTAEKRFLNCYYSLFRVVPHTVTYALLSLSERKQKKSQQPDRRVAVRALLIGGDEARRLSDAYTSASEAAAKAVESAALLAQRLRELGADFKPLRDVLSDMLPPEIVEELVSPKAPRKPRP